MARYLYSELAGLITARQNCRVSFNDEWFHKNTDKILELVKEFMPSGSGIDSGTKIDLDASTGEKLVFTFSYHHMNEGGMYDGWTEHIAYVTPSLQFGVYLRITGRNRNYIKEYLYDVFQNALTEQVD